MSRFLCSLRFEKYMETQKVMTKCVKMAIGRRVKALAVLGNTKIAANSPMKGYRRTKVSKFLLN